MRTDDLEIVEWHDGVLSRVARTGTGVALDFSRVFVYRAIAFEEYSVEACSALLDLLGARPFDVTGPVDVSDCDIQGPCEPYEIQKLLAGVGAGKLTLVTVRG